jgi:DNA polymerase III subunit alpha
VRARIISVEPLDQVASRRQKGLRVFLRDPAPLALIARGLAGRGEGEVSLVLATESGEVEMKLPGRYPATAQVAATLKAIPGILNVEHV